MGSLLTPGRSALGGAAVLMACACGVAANSATLVGSAGLGATTKVVHPVFIAVAAVLIIGGLWRARQASGGLAAAGFVAIAVGAVLTPPTVMTASAMPWSPLQLVGAGFYIVAAVLLGLAFFRAFPSPKPGAMAGGITGAALATGCGCCLVTGAIAGVGYTMGLTGEAFVRPSTALFWSGMLAIGVSAFLLGGWRAAVWVPVGAAVIRFGPDLLRMAGDWMVAGANLRSFAAYLVLIAGAGTLMYAMSVGYRRARVPREETVLTGLRPEPAPGG